MVGYDGSIRIDTKMDTKGFNKGMNGMTNAMKGFASIFVKVKIAQMIFEIGKSAVNMASQLQEVQNVVDTAFGSMAHKVEAFADTSIENFGMSELTAKRTASTYMAMSKGMGITGEAAADMALEITGLTGDMASFFNVSQDVADTALKSIWTGETEALKKFGVVMTQANLQQFAYSKGINKNISAMSQSELVMLRYKFVTEKLGLAQGDFAKTSGSWANQTRILSERWKEFLGLIGNAIIPVLLPVVQFLNRTLGLLINILRTIGDIYTTLTGKTVEVAKATTLAADSEYEFADGIDAAAKAAKKALAPFDDLNVLQTDMGNADIAMDDAFGGFSAIDMNETGVLGDIQENNKIQTYLNDLKTQLEQFTPYTDRLKEAMDRLKIKFEEFVNSPGVQAVLKFFKDLIIEIYKKQLAFLLLVLAGAVDFLSGWLDILSGLLMIVVGILTGDFGMAFDGAKKIVEGFRGLLIALGSLVESVLIVILGKDAVEALKTFISRWAKNISEWWTNDVIPWFTREKWIQLWNDIAQWWNDGWENISIWWDKNISSWWNEHVTPWFTREKWIDMMTGMKEGFVTSFKNGINGAIALFNMFISWINEKMKFSWDAIEIAGKQIVPAGNVQLFNIPSIPKLATGAVIPPNSEFLAILGDQKSGRNIEAPEGLIRQIIQEELEGLSGNQNVTINFAGNMGQLIRVLKPYIDTENRRVGNKLIEGAI